MNLKFYVTWIRKTTFLDVLSHYLKYTLYHLVQALAVACDINISMTNIDSLFYFTGSLVYI